MRRCVPGRRASVGILLTFLCLSPSCATTWKPPVGIVVAIDAQTGNTLWRSPRRPVAFNSDPVVRENAVHVNHVHCGSEQVVHYDTRSGEPIDGSLSDLSSPVVDGGMEFRPQLGASPIAQTVGPPPDRDGFRVMAVDARTGEPKWLTSVLSDGQPRLAAAGGVVAVVALESQSFDRLTLRVLAADDGRQLWSIEADANYPIGQIAVHGFTRMVPILGGGNVYVFNANGEMEARTARSGETKWKTKASPSVAAGATMVVAHDGSNVLAFDHRGRQLWKNSTLKGMSTVYPSLANGMVYVAASRGSPCPPSD